MRKFLLVSFFVIFIFSASQRATGANYSDEVISNAVTLTRSIDGGRAIKVLNGNNSTGQSVMIRFANLSSISIEYLNADAVTVIDSDDNMTIYIDKALINSPPEAIACLLEHETTHNDENSSIEEEVSAITREAEAWRVFVSKKPSLAKLDEAKYPLIDRLNYISEIYSKSGKDAIRHEVLSNKNYAKLAFHSIGF